MPTTQDQYDGPLAQRYSWMMGGNSGKGGSGRTASRFTAGSRCRLQSRLQCAALASLGHDPTIGIDTSEALIAEWKDARSGLACCRFHLPSLRAR